MDNERELRRLYGPEVVDQPQTGGSLRSASAQVNTATRNGFDPAGFVVSGDAARRQNVELWVRRLAWLLDESIKIPVIGRRVGIDGIVGLIPVVGDSVGLAASLSVIVSGLATGASVPTIARMVFNVGLDAFVGAIPLVGQVFDFIYKSNTLNLRLLEADLADREATRRSSAKVLVAAVVIAAIIFSIFVATVVFVIASIF